MREGRPRTCALMAAGTPEPPEALATLHLPCTALMHALHCTQLGHINWRVKTCAGA